MTNITRLLLAAALGLGLAAEPAQAQLARTFVSAAGGNDANDCNRPTPCRTFQAAHDKTFDQGEISILDSGGYGAVTITKSISIINDGVGEAGVLVSGGATAISIMAPGAYVSLRGLTIQGIGFGGGTGIDASTGAVLTIANCAIRNISEMAIRVNGTVGRLVVSNTSIADSTDGIRVRGNASLRASFNRVRITNSTNAGLFIFNDSTGAVDATLTESVIAHNAIDGVHVETTGTAPVRVMVARTVVANNNKGFLVKGGASAVRIGESTITGNGAGWQTTGGAVVQSFGDNEIDGNDGGELAPPLIPVN